MRSQPPGYGMLSVHASMSTMVNARSIVTRTHMSCIGMPARRTPVSSWKS